MTIKTNLASWTNSRQWKTMSRWLTVIWIELQEVIKLYIIKIKWLLSKMVGSHRTMIHFQPIDIIINLLNQLLGNSIWLLFVVNCKMSDHQGWCLYKTPSWNIIWIQILPILLNTVSIVRQWWVLGLKTNQKRKMKRIKMNWFKTILLIPNLDTTTLLEMFLIKSLIRMDTHKLMGNLLTMTTSNLIMIKESANMKMFW